MMWNAGTSKWKSATIYIERRVMTIRQRLLNILTFAGIALTAQVQLFRMLPHLQVMTRTGKKAGTVHIVFIALLMKLVAMRF